MFPSLSGGFAGIGNAHATITISTNAREAVQVMRQAGQDIQRSMRGASTAINDINRSIGTFRSEIFAIGAAGGLVTALGLGSARDLRNYRVRFRELLGTEQEANEVMEQLVGQANDFGLEISNVVELASSLLPVLEGNTAELDEWVKRAALLESLPGQRPRGSGTRAISEFLAGQTMSLQRLFNITPNMIQEAQAATDDFGEQLDYILQQMGATEAAALAQADAWVSVKNELRLLLAEGFTPLFETLQTNLGTLRQWLTTLRETNPEVAQLGAQLATVAAVGAPALLFLNQIISALQKIIAIAPLAQAGALGIAAIGGGLIAKEAVQFVGRSRGDERLAGINFREMVVDAMQSLSRLVVSAGLILLEGIQMIDDGLLAMAHALGRFVEWLGNILPDWAGGARLREAGGGIQTRALEVRGRVREDITAAQQAIIDDQIRGMESFAAALGVMTRETEATAARWAQMQSVAIQEEARRTPRAGDTGVAGFSEEQMDRIQAWDEFQDDLASIEAEAAADRLAEAQQYAEQRNEMIASYNQTLLREEEDFLRQRARQNARLEAQIQDINDERAEQEAEWQQDLNESIADIREDGSERVEQIEEDYARRRERLQEEHAFNLADAAGRLDAARTADLQRRHEMQMSQLDEDEQRAVQREQERLQERIQAAEEAHQERLQNAREADDERIADMREAMAEQQAIEDEDRAIRLERMQEDHEAQLEQLKQRHDDRLRQIDDQEREALDARRQAFIKQHREHTDFYDEWLRTQRQAHQASLDAWDDFWQGIQQGMITGMDGGSNPNPFFDGPGDMEESGVNQDNRPNKQELTELAISEMQDAGWAPSAIYNQTQAFNRENWTAERIADWIEDTFGVDVPGYRWGTPFVERTGPAILHRGEMVLRPEVAAMVRNSVTPFGSMAGSMDRAGANVTIENHIYPSQGMDERQLAELTAKTTDERLRRYMEAL